MKSILLLAGLSRRCGDVNKLLKNFGSSPLFSYSLTACLQNTDAIIVLGHERQRVRKAAEEFVNANNFDHSVKFVENPQYDSGQFSSILAGLDALCDGEDFCIALGDTPYLTKEIFAFLEAQFLSEMGGDEDDYDCLQPFCGDIPAHPVFCKARVKQVALRHRSEPEMTFQSLLSLENIRTKRLQISQGAQLLAKDVDFLEDFR